MSDAFERPKTYEEGLKDGFLKGQEEANKVMEQMLHTACNPVICDLPETEAVKLLQKENAELRRDKEDLIFVRNAKADHINELKDLLTKAKEIIEKLKALYLYPVVTKDDVKQQDEILNEAEQFLKGENIIFEDTQAGNSPFDADEVFNKEMKAYPDENKI